MVAYISESALTLLAKIDKPLLSRIKATIGKVNATELLHLIGTLENLREALT